MADPKSEKDEMKDRTKASPGPQAARRKFPGDGKITLLTDQHDKPYGPKNNPKRGMSAERFAIYENGMTVDGYISKGGKYADIPNDVGKKLISVTSPK